MIKLPLLPPLLPLPGSPEPAPPGCQACILGASPPPGQRGLRADLRDEYGSVLVLGSYPKAKDAPYGPFRTGEGLWVRQTVDRVMQEMADPRVSYDYAVKCVVKYRPVYKKTKDRVPLTGDECRSPMLDTLDRVRPSRILLFGETASRQLFGASYSAVDSRRGYAWFVAVPGEAPIPVFFMMDFAVGVPGYSWDSGTARWLTDDIQWALRVRPDQLERPATECEIVHVHTADEAFDVVDYFRGRGRVGHDCESYGTAHNADFRIVLLALSDGDTAWVFDDEAMKDPEIQAELRELYADRSVIFEGHAGKYDATAVWLHLGVMPRDLIDTMTLRTVIDVSALGRLSACQALVGMAGSKDEAAQIVSDTRARLMKYRNLVRKALGQKSATVFADPPAAELAAALDGRTAKPPDWIHAGVSLNDPAGFAYGLASTDPLTKPAMLTYCALDAISTARISRVLEPRVRACKAHANTWVNLVRKASYAVARMEQWGLGVDDDARMRFATLLDLKLLEVADPLKEAGLTNPGSAQQVSALLFGKLGLHSSIRTKVSGAPSVNDEAMRLLIDQHPIVAAIIDYRACVKMQTNYARGLARHVRDDGRIHAHFRIGGAESGRMSCSDPNMQTIPSRGIYAKMAKAVYAAREGWKLVNFDYAQIELRIAALLSQDARMIEIFQGDRDYHSETASVISMSGWGVKFWKPTAEDYVTRPEESQLMDDIRRAAKVVIFGLLYGMGDASLSTKIKLGIEATRSMRQALLGGFKGLPIWTAKCVRDARATGYCQTWWDGSPARRRNLPDIFSTDRAKAVHAEHASWNTPVQGTAADFGLASLSKIVAWIESDEVPAMVVLSVHDSIVLEVRDDAVPEVLDAVPKIMCGWNSGGVPITVDGAVGQSLGDMKKV